MRKIAFFSIGEYSPTRGGLGNIPQLARLLADCKLAKGRGGRGDICRGYCKKLASGRIFAVELVSVVGDNLEGCAVEGNGVVFSKVHNNENREIF